MTDKLVKQVADAFCEQINEQCVREGNLKKKIIPGFHLSKTQLKTVASELRKLEKEDEQLKLKKKDQRELMRHRSRYFKQKEENLLDLVTRISEELLDYFDEKDGLDIHSETSISYHIDNELYTKVKDCTENFQSELKKIC